MIPKESRDHLVNCVVLDHSTEKDQARYRNGKVILVDLEVVEMSPKKKKLSSGMIQDYSGCRHRRIMIQVRRNLGATSEKGQEDCNVASNDLLKLGGFFSRGLPEEELLSDDVLQFEHLGRLTCEWLAGNCGCVLDGDSDFCRVCRIHAEGLVGLVFLDDGRNRFRMSRLNVSVSLLFPLAPQAAKGKVEMA